VVPPAPLKLTENVSSDSTVVSLGTEIVIVPLVCPAGIVSVTVPVAASARIVFLDRLSRRYQIVIVLLFSQCLLKAETVFRL
jgi:hypothetical protein